MADNVFEYTYEFKPAEIDLSSITGAISFYDKLNESLASVQANVESVTNGISRMGRVGQQQFASLNAQASTFNTEISTVKNDITETQEQMKNYNQHYNDMVKNAEGDEGKLQKAQEYKQQIDEWASKRAYAHARRARNITSEAEMYGLSNGKEAADLGWDFSTVGAPVFDMKEQQAALQSYSDQMQKLIAKWAPQLTNRIRGLMQKNGNPISDAVSQMMNYAEHSDNETTTQYFENTIADMTGELFAHASGHSNKERKALAKSLPQGFMRDMVRSVKTGNRDDMFAPDQEYIEPVRDMLRQAMLAGMGAVNNPVMRSISSAGYAGGKMPTTIPGLMKDKAFQGLFENDLSNDTYLGRQMVDANSSYYLTAKGKQQIAKLVASNPSVARAALLAKRADGTAIGYRTSGMGIGLNLDSVKDVGALMDALTTEYLVKLNGQSANVNAEGTSAKLMQNLMAAQRSIKVGDKEVTDYVSSWGKDEGPNGYGFGGKTADLIRSIRKGIKDLESDDDQTRSTVDAQLATKTYNRMKNGGSAGAIEEAATTLMHMLENPEYITDSSMPDLAGSGKTITALTEQAREKQTQMLIEKLIPFRSNEWGKSSNEGGFTWLTKKGERVPAYGEWTPMSENGFTRALGLDLMHANEKTSLIKEIEWAGMEPSLEKGTPEYDAQVKRMQDFLKQAGADPEDANSPYVVHSNHGQSGITTRLIRRDAYEAVERNFAKKFTIPYAKRFGLLSDEEAKMSDEELMPIVAEKVGTFWNNLTPEGSYEGKTSWHGSIPKFAKELENRNKRWSPGVDMSGSSIDWLNGGIDANGEEVTFDDIIRRSNDSKNTEEPLRSGKNGGGNLPSMALVDLHPYWIEEFGRRKKEITEDIKTNDPYFKPLQNPDIDDETRAGYQDMLEEKVRKQLKDEGFTDDEKGKLFGFDSASEGEGYVNSEFAQGGSFQGRFGFGGKGMILSMDDIAKTLAVARGGDNNYTLNNKGQRVYRAEVPSAYQPGLMVALESVYDDKTGEKLGSNYDGIIDVSAQKDKASAQKVYNAMMDTYKKDEDAQLVMTKEEAMQAAQMKANEAYNAQIAATGMYVMNRSDNDTSTDNVGVQGAQWIRFSPGLMQHQAEALQKRIERLRTPEGMAEVFGGAKATNNFYAQGLLGLDEDIADPMEFYYMNKNYIDQKVGDYRNSLMRRSTSGEFLNHDGALGKVETLGNATKIENARVLTNPWTAMLATMGINEEKDMREIWGKAIDKGADQAFKFDDNDKVSEGPMKGLTRDRINQTMDFLYNAQDTLSSERYGRKAKKKLTGDQVMGVLTMTGYGKEGDEEYLPAGFVDFDRPQNVQESFIRSPTGIGQIYSGTNYASMFGKSFRKLSGQDTGVLFNFSTMQRLAGADWDGDMIKVLTSGKYDMKKIRQMRKDAGLSDLKTSKDVIDWMASGEKDGYRALRDSGRIGGKNFSLVDDVANSMELLDSMGIMDTIVRHQKGSKNDRIDAASADEHGIQSAKDKLKGVRSLDLVEDLLRRGYSPVGMGGASDIATRLVGTGITEKGMGFWTQLAMQSNNLYDAYTTHAKRPVQTKMTPGDIAALGLGPEFSKGANFFDGRYALTGNERFGFKVNGMKVDPNEVFEHNGIKLYVGRDNGMQHSLFERKKGGFTIDKIQMASRANRANVMSALAMGYLQSAGAMDDTMAEVNKAFLTEDATYLTDGNNGPIKLDENGNPIRVGGGLGYGMLDVTTFKDGHGLDKTKKLVKNFRGLLGQSLGGKNMIWTEKTRATLARQMAEADDEIAAYADEIVDTDEANKYIDQDKITSMQNNGKSEDQIREKKLDMITSKIKNMYGWASKEMALGGHNVQLYGPDGKIDRSDTLTTSFTIPELMDSLMSHTGLVMNKDGTIEDRKFGHQTKEAENRYREARDIMMRMLAVTPLNEDQLIDSSVSEGRTKSEVIDSIGMERFVQNAKNLLLTKNLSEEQYAQVLDMFPEEYRKILDPNYKEQLPPTLESSVINLGNRKIITDKAVEGQFSLSLKGLSPQEKYEKINAAIKKLNEEHEARKQAEAKAKQEAADAEHVEKLEAQAGIAKQPEPPKVETPAVENKPAAEVKPEKKEMSLEEKRQLTRKNRIEDLTSQLDHYKKRLEDVKNAPDEEFQEKDPGAEITDDLSKYTDPEIRAAAERSLERKRKLARATYIKPKPREEQLAEIQKNITSRQKELDYINTHSDEEYEAVVAEKERRAALRALRKIKGDEYVDQKEKEAPARKPIPKSVSVPFEEPPLTAEEFAAQEEQLKSMNLQLFGGSGTSKLKRSTSRKKNAPILNADGQDKNLIRQEPTDELADQVVGGTAPYIPEDEDRYAAITGRDKSKSHKFIHFNFQLFGNKGSTSSKKKKASAKTNEAPAEEVPPPETEGGTFIIDDEALEEIKEAGSKPEKKSQEKIKKTVDEAKKQVEKTVENISNAQADAIQNGVDNNNQQLGENTKDVNGTKSSTSRKKVKTPTTNGTSANTIPLQPNAAPTAPTTQTVPTPSSTHKSTTPPSPPSPPVQPTQPSAQTSSSSATPPTPPAHRTPPTLPSGLDPTNPEDLITIINAGKARSDIMNEIYSDMLNFQKYHPDTSKQVTAVAGANTPIYDSKGNIVGMTQAFENAQPNHIDAAMIKAANKGTNDAIELERRGLEIEDMFSLNNTKHIGDARAEQQRDLYSQLVKSFMGSAGSDAWLAVDDLNNAMNQVMGSGSASKTIGQLSQLDTTAITKAEAALQKAQNIFDQFEIKEIKDKNGNMVHNPLYDRAFVRNGVETPEYTESKLKLEEAKVRLAEQKEQYGGMRETLFEKIRGEIVGQQLSNYEAINGRDFQSVGFAKSIDEQTNQRIVSARMGAYRLRTDIQNAIDSHSAYFDPNSADYNDPDVVQYRNFMLAAQADNEQTIEDFNKGTAQKKIRKTVQKEQDAQDQLDQFTQEKSMRNLEQSQTRMKRMQSQHVLQYMPFQSLRNYDQYKYQLENTVSEAKQTRDSYMEQMIKYQSAGDKQGYQRALQGYNKAQENVDVAEGMLKSNSGIGGIAKNLGLSAISKGLNVAKQAIAKAFKQIINIAVQFVQQWNQTMAGVSAKSGLTGEELDQLEQTIQNQAAKLKVSSVQLAKTYQTLFSSGFDTSEVEHAAEVLTKFSTVTGQDATKSIKQLSQVVKTGLVSSLDEAMDMLTALSDQSTATAADISKVLAKMSGTALSSGMTAGETTGLATFATEIFGGSASAGNDIGMILSRVTSLSEANQTTAFGSTQSFTDSEGREFDVSDLKALERTSGVNFFRESANGEDEEMNTPFEILTQIAEKWDEMTDTTKNAFTSMFGGTSGRQSNTFTTLMNAWSLNPELVQQYIETAENSENTVNQQYRTMTSTVSSAKQQATTGFTNWISDITGGSDGWLQQTRLAFWNGISSIFGSNNNLPKISVDLSNIVEIKTDSLDDAIDFMEEISAKYSEMTEELSEADQEDVAAVIDQISAAFPGLITEADKAVTSMAELVGLMELLNEEKDKLLGDNATEQRGNYDYNKTIGEYQQELFAIDNTGFARFLSTDNSTTQEKWLEFANAYADNVASYMSDSSDNNSETENYRNPTYFEIVGAALGAVVDYATGNTESKHNDIDFAVSTTDSDEASRNWLGKALRSYGAIRAKMAAEEGSEWDETTLNQKALEFIDSENGGYWDEGTYSIWEGNYNYLEQADEDIGRLLWDYANGTTYDSMSADDKLLWDNYMSGAYQYLLHQYNVQGLEDAGAYLGTYYGSIISSDAKDRERDILYEEYIDKLFSEGVFAGQTMDDVATEYFKTYLKESVFTKEALANGEKFYNINANDIIADFQKQGYFDEYGLFDQEAFKNANVGLYSKYTLFGHELLGDTQNEAYKYYLANYAEADAARGLTVDTDGNIVDSSGNIVVAKTEDTNFTTGTIALNNQDELLKLMQAKDESDRALTWEEIIAAGNAGTSTYKNYVKEILNASSQSPEGIKVLNGAVSINGEYWDQNQITGLINAGGTEMQEAFADYENLTPAEAYALLEKYYIGEDATSAITQAKEQINGTNGYNARVLRAQRLLSGNVYEGDLSTMLEDIGKSEVEWQALSEAEKTSTIQNYQTSSINAAGNVFEEIVPVLQGVLDLNNYIQGEAITYEEQRAIAEEQFKLGNAQAEAWIEAMDYIQQTEGLYLEQDETGAFTVKSNKFAATQTGEFNKIRQVIDNGIGVTDELNAKNLGLLLNAGADWESIDYVGNMNTEQATTALQEKYGQDLSEYLYYLGLQENGTLSSDQAKKMTELKVKLTFETYGVQESEHYLDDLQQKIENITEGGADAQKALTGITVSGQELSQQNAAARAIIESGYNFAAIQSEEVQKYIMTQLGVDSIANVTPEMLQGFVRQTASDNEAFKNDIDLLEQFKPTGLSGSALYERYGFNPNAAFDTGYVVYPGVTSSTLTDIIRTGKTEEFGSGTQYSSKLLSFIDTATAINEAKGYLTDEEGNFDLGRYYSLREAQQEQVQKAFDLSHEQLLSGSDVVLSNIEKQIKDVETTYTEMQSIVSGEVEVGLETGEIAEAQAALEAIENASPSVDVHDSYLGQIDDLCKDITTDGILAAESLENIAEKMNELSQTNALANATQSYLDNGGTVSQMLLENPTLLNAIMKATGWDFTYLTGPNGEQALKNFIEQNGLNVKNAENDTLALKASEYNQAISEASFLTKGKKRKEAEEAGFIIGANGLIDTSSNDFAKNVTSEQLDAWMAGYGFNKNASWDDETKSYGYSYDLMKSFAEATSYSDRLGILRDYVTKNQSANEAADLVSSAGGIEAGWSTYTKPEKELIAETYGYSSVDDLEAQLETAQTLIDEKNAERQKERQETLSGYIGSFDSSLYGGLETDTEEQKYDKFAQALVEGKLDEAGATEYMKVLAQAYVDSGAMTSDTDYYSESAMQERFGSILNGATSTEEVISQVENDAALKVYIAENQELSDLYDDLKTKQTTLTKAQRDYSKQIGKDKSTLNSYRKEMAKLRENIQNVKYYADKTSYSSDDKKEIASILGLSEETVKSMTNGEIADMLNSELDDLGQQYEEKLNSMWSDIGSISAEAYEQGLDENGNMVYDIGGVQIVANQPPTVVGLDEAIAMAQALGQDALVAELESLQGMGGEVSLETWTDSEGNLHAAYNGVELSGVSGKKSSSSGGGGKSAAEKKVEKWKHKTEDNKHQINMAKGYEEYYQETGNLAQYGKELTVENQAQENYIKTQEAAIADYRSSLSSVTKDSDDWYTLTDAIQEAEEEILSAKTAIEKNTKALEENRKAMRKTRTELEDYYEQLIEAQEEYEDSKLSGTVDMQDTILEAIKDRYQKEWDLQKEDLEKKKEALQEEKDMIDERLQARKDAENAANEYEEVAELEKQLALISMDSTRASEAADLREQLAEKKSALAWEEAEAEAAAQSSMLEDQINGIDEYESAEDERVSKYLEDANNFADEVAEILGGSDEEIMEWLKNNVDEYGDYLSAAQEQQVEKWLDTYKQMLGITDTYWDQINELISGGFSAGAAYLMTTQDYINASDTERYDMLMELKDMIDDYNSAYNTTAISSSYDATMESALQKLEDAINSGNAQDISSALTNYESLVAGTAEGLHTDDFGNGKTATSDNTKAVKSNTESLKAVDSTVKSMTSGLSVAANVISALTSTVTSFTNKIVESAKNASQLSSINKKSGSAADGGVFNYTGQVLVHGTNEHPEYIFNEDQLKALSKIGYTPYNVSVGSDAFGSSNTIGDVSITINQAEIASDVDVDRLAAQVGEKFVQQISVQGYRTGRF